MFNSSVINGVLYDEFIDRFPGELNRDKAKEIMLEVLFSRNQVYSGYKKIIPYQKDKSVFASVYPFIYEVVKILKTQDHKILPIYLQKLESYIFIDRLCKELVDHGIVPLTIHDSVIVGQCDQELTIKIIKMVFKQGLGVLPTLDIKIL